MKPEEWAQQKLKDKGDWVILDTETTGLNGEIVEVAIISGGRQVLLNTRVKPTGLIELGASAVHGITEDDLLDAPSFPEVYPAIKKAVSSKTVLIYNAVFDVKILTNCCKINDLPLISFNSECVMLPYSEWVGEWNEYYGNYKWQKLPAGDHSALGDCLATLGCLEKMAGKLYA